MPKRSTPRGPVEEVIKALRALSPVVRRASVEDDLVLAEALQAIQRGVPWGQVATRCGLTVSSLRQGFGSWATVYCRCAAQHIAEAEAATKAKDE